MAGEFSLAEGKKLVKLARKSVQYTLASGMRLKEPCESKRFEGQRGVFVTLHSFPKMELRGCIGFPYPEKPLWSSVIEAAVEAAFRDPRFPPLGAGEAENIVIEVSVLSVPVEIAGDRKKLPEKIAVGKDGIMVKKGYHSGLFLPQVAPEQGWDAKTFLEQCCAKAGMMENMWLLAATKVFKFQAQVFSENRPDGEVEEKM